MWLDVAISSFKVYRTLHKHVACSEVLAGAIIGVPGLVGTPGCVCVCVCVCGRDCPVALCGGQCPYIYIQGVPGGMDKILGECSLC